MALTFGPRLGRPSSTGFSVWVKADSASTIKVETRKTGTTAWTLRGTQATGTWNSAAVFVTGLAPRTKYDYRVLQNDVQVATNSTWTMPNSGQFVMYHVSDFHNDTDAIFLMILQHYEAFVEPSGIPAFIYCGGDLCGAWTPAAATVDAVCNAQTALYVDAQQRIFQCTGRIPMIYMFDDWDWAGNNSAYDHLPAVTGVGGDRALIVASQAAHWQDRGPCTHLGRTINGQSYDNYTFGTEIAGVPFLFMDTRSEKLQGGALTLPAWRGTESNTLWQADLREWMRQWLVQHSDRAMVFIGHGGTFRAPTVNVTPTTYQQAGAAARDGASIYHQQDLWDVVRVCCESGYTSRNSLVILTGDDHGNIVHDGAIVTPRDRDSATNTFPQPGPPVPCKFREFKVTSGARDDLGFGIFGRGNVFDDQVPSAATFAIYEITSLAGGRNVTARVRYTQDQLGTPLSDDFNRAANWWFDNGTWVDYDLNNTVVVQKYPSDNGHAAGYLFERWYMDEVDGTMHPESQMGRENWTRKLRAINNFDEPGTDELRDGWEIRTEETHPEPE